jgi:nitric oxide reductase subunit C
MLSRSAARAFFLVGTGLSGLAFVGLTFDTFQRIPAQTNSAAITPAVERGHTLWDENNCMGCHTLLGEGAYYAPELTRVHTRRGDQFIRAMLRDPAAMYPGQRQMVQYDFTEREIDDLVAFLAWIDGMDLNGFPPSPTITMPGSPAGPVTRSSRPVVFDQMCTACHAVGGSGGSIGPALDDVAARRDTDYLTRWLHDPQAVKPGTRMPNLRLSDEQVTELVTYLGTLTTGEQP